MRAVPSSFIQQIFIDYFFLYMSASVLGFQDIKMNKINKNAWLVRIYILVLS